jgi:hypothetical protein
MRHRAQARHARYHSPRPVRALALTALASVLTISAGIGLSASGSSAATVRPAYTALDDRAYDLPAADQTSRDGFHATELAAMAATSARQAHAAMLAALPRYTVHAGDSLSAVALDRCSGQARDWTDIYAASRELGLTARDANTLTAGQHLAIRCAYDASQLRFAPAPPPPAPVRTVTAAAVTPNRSQGSVGSSAARSNVGGTYAGSGSMQRCIISRESGGNSQVRNSSGHYGLYQFSESTWVGSGGSAADFGHASVAEQNQVFANAVAARGYSDWTAYDGCGA